ncbi:MAG: hypothetical protein AB7S83_03275 [Candidatus Methanomethylophilaceae archaeon]
MKVYSTHFVLKGKSDYKDLAPVFPDILGMLLEEIGQLPDEEEIMQMYIEENTSDLKNNRKPEGYNRKGKVRLVFPIGSKEFYLKSYSKSTDLASISDRVSEMLSSAGVTFDVKKNDRIEFE